MLNHISKWGFAISAWPVMSRLYPSGVNNKEKAYGNFFLEIVAISEPQEQRAKPPYHNGFSYDANADSYACPSGQTLKFLETRSVTNKIVMVYGGLGAVCRLCSAFGSCTKNRYRGRELLIGRYDTLLRNHRNGMATPLAKIAYRRRKELSEPT